MNGYTRKIFYEDQYVTKFSAAVVSCEPSDSVFHVVLDATAFYPEGGGQPADTGLLGGVPVLGAIEDGERILHITDAPLEVSSAVDGQVDWARRFSFMQQHTGEHIVSGLIHKLYGYDNVGFHMGSEFTTMDINGELTENQLMELEILANNAIYENTAVNSRYPDGVELEKMEYRSKKALTGDVRIVTVEGYDKCACCGLHCRTSGEVGIIKLVMAQKYKSGTRIYMLCGLRAVNDYYRKNRDIYALTQLFSVKPDEVTAAARQCHNENAELKRKLALYRTRELESKAAQAAAGQALICLFEENFTPDELRRFCVMLNEKAVVAAVFSEVEGIEGSYRYAVGSVSEDMRELSKRLNTALNGRGGGSKNLAQGTVNASRVEVEEFFNNL